MDRTGSRELVDLNFANWEGTHRAELTALPRSATVGQAVSEAALALQMPWEGLFKALFRGRELNADDTLDDAGVDSGAEIEIVPDVSAG